MTAETQLAGNYDPELPATKIIGKWGSNSRFARSLNKTHSTTARWLASGYVPGEYHAEVMAAAKRDSIILDPVDFVDLRLFRDAA